MEQIAENVFVETGFFGSNDSMIVTEEGIVLIDSPFRPSDALRWRAEIEARGEVLYLVNTDDHVDHTLGNSFLGGRIIAHEETRRKMAETPPHPSNKALMSVLSANDPAGSAVMGEDVRRLPSVTVSDRMTLHLGTTVIQLMHFKGHTRNGLMAYLPQQRILFSGDNVCEGSLPTFKEACLQEWFETLDHIVDMGVDLIVPGHGAVCGKDTARLFRDQMDELVSRVRGEMDRGLLREQIVEKVRYEDRIHTGTEAYPGYPPEMLEDFQRKSVARIYDEVLATLTAPGQSAGRPWTVL